MHCIIGPMLFGAIAGGMGANRDRRRTLIRGIIKNGIAAKRKVEAMGATVVAEAEKITEEARQELDRAETELHS
jgi:hypothetical protein